MKSEPEAPRVIEVQWFHTDKRSWQFSSRPPKKCRYFPVASASSLDWTLPIERQLLEVCPTKFSTVGKLPPRNTRSWSTGGVRFDQIVARKLTQRCSVERQLWSRQFANLNFGKQPLCRDVHKGCYAQFPVMNSFCSLR
jgi:hypothetical protein